MKESGMTLSNLFYNPILIRFFGTKFWLSRFYFNINLSYSRAANLSKLWYEFAHFVFGCIKVNVLSITRLFECNNSIIFNIKFSINRFFMNQLLYRVKYLFKCNSVNRVRCGKKSAINIRRQDYKNVAW